MHTLDLLRQFERDGFLVIDDFFDRELMQVLDRRIRDHFGDSPEFIHNGEFLDKAQTDVIPWFPQSQDVKAFDVVDHDSKLRKISELTLGPGWVSLYCMVMFSKQGTSGQAWHQDCAPEDSQAFNLNRLVYTTDITDETGGQLVVVPGSHKQGLLPAGDPVGEFENQLVLRPRQGALVLLHGHTWHRVLPVSGPNRFSINYRAVPATAPADVTDVCVYRNMRYQFSTSRIIEHRVA